LDRVPAYAEDAKNYTRKTVLKGDEKEIVFDFAIPSPLYGKVLHADGTLAANCRAWAREFTANDGETDFIFGGTDDKGEFMAYRRPKNVFLGAQAERDGKYEINITPYTKLPDEEVVIRLEPACVVRGRLIDIATGEPMKNQLFFYQYGDKNDPEKTEGRMPWMNTDDEGRFVIPNIAAGVCYRLFIVRGRTEGYYSNPYVPRVDLVTVVPEKAGQEIDLGDITVDLTKASADLDSMVTEKWFQAMGPVLAGNAKLALVAFGNTPFCENMTQLLDPATGSIDENVLAGYSAATLDAKDVTISRKNRFEHLAQNKDGGTIMVTNNRTVNAGITLAELRGEQNSAWNVSADDPSRDGDWKNDSAGINPKILESFLRDTLDQIENPKARPEMTPEEKELMGKFFAAVEKAADENKSLILFVVATPKEHQTLLPMLDEKINPLMKDYAVVTCEYEKLPQSMLDSLKNENLIDPEASAIAFLGTFHASGNGPELSSINLPGLCGERDSEWNATLSDDERKNNSGVINPRILENFLKSSLERVRSE